MKTITNKTISGIIEIARGMFTILKHMFRPAITLEYPEVRPVLNSRYRGRLALKVKPDGSDICSGCGMCAKACPCGDLIQIQKEKDENNKFVVTQFTIDIGRCIFCGNCTEVCPSKALIMTDGFELADYSREAMVYDKERLKLSVEESARWTERKELDE